jgi:hypothetical protein
MQRSVAALLFFLPAASPACEPTSKPGATPSTTTPAVPPMPVTSQGQISPPSPPSNPVTLRISNPFAQDRFFEATPSRQPSLRMEQLDAGAWKEVLHREPFCVAPCAFGPANTPCPECAKPRPMVRRVAAGATAMESWSGELFDLVPAPAGCRCYRRRPAPPGRYRLTACASPGIDCYGAACPAPDADGFIEHRNLSLKGNQVCTTIELTLPAPGGQIDIALQK